jgi:hypothetical protein
MPDRHLPVGRVVRTARKLTLRKEALAELGTTELRQVAAGEYTLTGCAISRDVNPCPTREDPVCDLYSRYVTGGCVPTFPC